MTRCRLPRRYDFIYCIVFLESPRAISRFRSRVGDIESKALLKSNSRSTVSSLFLLSIPSLISYVNRSNAV